MGFNAQNPFFLIKLPAPELLVGAGKVLGGKGAEQGEFTGKDRGTDDLGKFLCIRAGWGAASGNPQQPEAFRLGLDSGATADGADRQGGKGDGDIDTGLCKIDGRDAGAAVNGMGSVLPAGNEHRGNDIGGMGVKSQRAGPG